MLLIQVEQRKQHFSLIEHTKHHAVAVQHLNGFTGFLVDVIRVGDVVKCVDMGPIQAGRSMIFERMIPNVNCEQLIWVLSYARN